MNSRTASEIQPCASPLSALLQFHDFSCKGEVTERTLGVLNLAIASLSVQRASDILSNQYIVNLFLIDAQGGRAGN